MQQALFDLTHQQIKSAKRSFLVHQSTNQRINKSTSQLARSASNGIIFLPSSPKLFSCVIGSEL
jgi:hypothetical protein